MTPPFDWDAHLREGRATGRSAFDRVALKRLAAPTAEDTKWLLQALKDERRGFVARSFGSARTCPEGFFQPLMDAGIDECEPSGCRPFISPCVRAFGGRRSREYLHHVIEFGCDRRKVGALLGLYWCVSWMPRDPMDDVLEREKGLLLNTWLSSNDRLVRFAALRSLPMFLEAYPEHLRLLAAQFIEAAKQSKDRHTQQLVQFRLEPNPTAFPDTWPSDLET